MSLLMRSSPAGMMQSRRICPEARSCHRLGSVPLRSKRAGMWGRMLVCAADEKENAESVESSEAPSSPENAGRPEIKVRLEFRWCLLVIGLGGDLGTVQ